MSSPRVSVVMPVWGPHPRHFPAAVRGVLDQTVRDLELVIVEDPSERRAADLLTAFDDPRIRHVVNPRRTSLVEQRNRCLAEARAEWVALQDADDVSEPHRLERQLDYLAANPDVAVFGSQLRIIDDADRPCGFRAYPRDHDAIVRAMRRYNPVGQPSVVYRRDVVRGAGGYQYGKYPSVEDYDLWCRLARAGHRFANHAEPLVRYRVHPEGSKTAKLRGILRGTIDVKRTHWGREMDAGARARLWAERLMLALPPRLVLALFLRTQYSTRLPA